MKTVLKKIYQSLPFLPLLKMWRGVRTPSYYKFLTINGNFSSPLPNGKKLKLNSNHQLYIEKEIFWHGIESEFEPMSLKIWMKLASEANVILDIGANTGVFSMLAGKFSSGKVYAFEPVPYNYSILQKNIALNPDVNVELQTIALSDKNATVDMFIEPDTVNYINSLNNDRLDQSKAKKIEVKCQRLDDLVTEKNIPTIDLIKIDVEGHEEAVLKGGQNSIQKFRPSIIIEVLNDKMGSGIQTFFDELGEYFYYRIDDDKKEIRRVSDIRTPHRINYLLSPKRIDL